MTFRENRMAVSNNRQDVLDVERQASSIQSTGSLTASHNVQTPIASIDPAPAFVANGESKEAEGSSSHVQMPANGIGEALNNSNDATRSDRARRELRRITLNFTPSWFSVNMGTGISSILLHQLPYQFQGLGIISNVLFGLNVVLFLLFVAISVARYTIWPTMGPTMLFHPTQSLFLGTFAMGFATIVNMCALSAAPAWVLNLLSSPGCCGGSTRCSLL